MQNNNISTMRRYYCSVRNFSYYVIIIIIKLLLCAYPLRRLHFPIATIVEALSLLKTLKTRGFLVLRLSTETSRMWELTITKFKFEMLKCYLIPKQCPGVFDEGWLQ